MSSDIDIEIKGKKYLFKINYNNQSDMERELGNIGACIFLQDKIKKGFSLNEMSVIIKAYLGLMRPDRGQKLHGELDSVDFDDFVYKNQIYCSEKCVRILADSYSFDNKKKDLKE